MSFRITYDGDTDKAKILRVFALHQASILHNLMSFRDLKEDIRKVRLADGTEILCHSHYGEDDISIFVPPIPPTEEEEEREELRFLSGLPIVYQDSFTYIGWTEDIGPPSYVHVPEYEIAGKIEHLDRAGLKKINNRFVKVAKGFRAMTKDEASKCEISFVVPTVFEEWYGFTPHFDSILFYVNDIEITDKKWTYANWFALTGIPATWKAHIIGTCGHGLYAERILMKVEYRRGKKAYEYAPLQLISGYHDTQLSMDWGYDARHFWNDVHTNDDLGGSFSGHVGGTVIYTRSYEGGLWIYRKAARLQWVSPAAPWLCDIRLRFDAMQGEDLVDFHYPHSPPWISHETSQLGVLIDAMNVRTTLWATKFPKELTCIFAGVQPCV